MEEPIEGKVAAIIDENKFVINRGRIAGVGEGMTFAIFTIGEEVIDPKTGVSLGNFEDVKAKVKVIYVQEKMCTALRIPEDANPQALKVEIGNSAREYISMSQITELVKLHLK
jgi:hypothetical protein